MLPFCNNGKIFAKYFFLFLNELKNNLCVYRSDFLYFTWVLVWLNLLYILLFASLDLVLGCKKHHTWDLFHFKGRESLFVLIIIFLIIDAFFLCIYFCFSLIFILFWNIIVWKLALVFHYLFFYVYLSIWSLQINKSSSFLGEGLLKGWMSQGTPWRSVRFI